jgi:hypothetical protein
VKATGIDLYCERIGDGLWAEPLNAVTNVAFFVAAFLAWRLRWGGLDQRLGTLILLMVLVGVGSGLFHTFATSWARVADAVPILLFSMLFLWMYQRDVLGVPRRKARAVAALPLGGVLVGGLFPDVANGSLFYVPVLILLVAFGELHYRSHLAARRMLPAAAGLFLASLMLRTVDNAACSALPAGTHFLWHVLNAAVLYMLFVTLASGASQWTRPRI